MSTHCKMQLDALKSETTKKSEYLGVRVHFLEKRLRADSKRE